MKVLMLKTVRGAEDGVTVRTYEEGKEYELGPAPGALDLAAVFVREGWAAADAPAPAGASPAPQPESPAIERAPKRGRR